MERNLPKKESKMKKNALLNNFVWRFAERCGAQLVTAIILLLFIGFIAVFYGGFYMDSGRDNPINTFVRTENKEILIKDKDKWKPFEVRGIDMGSGIPGEWLNRQLTLVSAK